MATPIVQIASLEIDTNQVIKESARLKGNLDKLKATNKELEKSGKGASEQYQKNAAEIKNLSKEYGDNQKLAASLIAVSKDTSRAMATEGKSVHQLRQDRAKLQQLGKHIIGDTKEEIEARNKLNAAIDAQTELIKSDASPAYVRQADNIGNYIGMQTELNSVIETGSSIINVAKGIYAGYGERIKDAFGQIRNATAGTEGLSGAQKAGAVTTNALSGAMKILKFAFAATGIGALVLAVISLVSYFSKTQEGADKLSKVMAAVGAAIDVVVDRVSHFGGALVQFFSGDFSGGFDKMKESLSGLGDEIAREASLAYDLEAAFQAVEDREIGLIEKQAERKKNIAALKLAAKDQTKSTEERVKLLEEAGEIERASLEDELAIARERARIADERNNLGESSRDDMRATAEAQAKVLELERASLGLQESLESEKQGLLAQIRATTTSQRNERVKAEIDSYNLDLQIFKESNKKKLKTSLESLQELHSRELALVQEKVNKGILTEQKAVLERLKLDNSYLEQKAAIDDKELDRIKSFNDRKKALEDKIAIARAYTQQEAEELRIEQEYEKHVAELETLALNETEKTELLALLTEERNIALHEVDAKARKERAAANKKTADDEAKLEEKRRADKAKTFDLINQLAGAETGIGKAALIAKQILAAKEQAVNLGLFTSKASLKLGEATTDIAAGTAKSASAAPFPANIPLIAGFLGTVAGIIGSIKKATSAGKAAALPKAARGAYLQGASHADGGILIEAEGGEAIINKNSTSKYRSLLSAINEAGGGIPLAANGGIASGGGATRNFIDYDLLAAKVAEANRSLPSPVVSVEEIVQTAESVKVAENLGNF